MVTNGFTIGLLLSEKLFYKRIMHSKLSKSKLKIPLRIIVFEMNPQQHKRTTNRELFVLISEQFWFNHQFRSIISAKTCFKEFRSIFKTYSVILELV